MDIRKVKKLITESRYKKNGQPTSTLGTFVTVLRGLRGHFGELRVREFGPLMLEQARAKFVASGLSRSVANRYTRLVIKIFRFGVSKELVPVSVPAALATVEPIRPEPVLARRDVQRRWRAERFSEEPEVPVQPHRILRLAAEREHGAAEAQEKQRPGRARQAGDGSRAREMVELRELHVR